MRLRTDPRHLQEQLLPQPGKRETARQMDGPGILNRRRFHHPNGRLGVRCPHVGNMHFGSTTVSGQIQHGSVDFRQGWRSIGIAQTESGSDQQFNDQMLEL